MQFTTTWKWKHLINRREMEWVLGLLMSIPSGRAGVTCHSCWWLWGAEQGLRANFSETQERVLSRGITSRGIVRTICCLCRAVVTPGVFSFCRRCQKWGPCWQRGAPFSRLACHTLQPPWQLINASAVEWQFCFTPSSIIPAPFPGGLRTLTNCHIT